MIRAGRIIAALLGIALTSSLPACAVHLRASEPPTTSKDLVALLKRLADSGYVNRPDNLGQMLGVSFIKTKHFPNQSNDECAGSTSPGRWTYYDVTTYTANSDIILRYRKMPVTNTSIVVGPVPRVVSGADDPSITYKYTIQRDCSSPAFNVDTSLQIGGLLNWQIELSELRQLLPEGEFNPGTDFASNYSYYPPQKDSVLSLQIAYSSKGRFLLSGAEIQQGSRVTRLRQDHVRSQF